MNIMRDFDRLLLIGVIFDISSNSQTNGTRNIDIIKDVLLKNILNDDFSKIYVSHPNFTMVPRDQGESTYYLISYKEPNKFSIDEMFKKSVMTVGECKEDCEKHVFLITDRFQTVVNYQYRKSFLMNEIRGWPIKIHVYGIGDIYDKLNMKAIAEEYNADYVHLDNVLDFEKEIIKFMGE